MFCLYNSQMYMKSINSQLANIIFYVQNSHIVRKCHESITCPWRSSLKEIKFWGLFFKKLCWIYPKRREFKMLKRCSVTILISSCAFKLHDHSLLANASPSIVSQIFASVLLYSRMNANYLITCHHSLTNSLFKIKVLNVHSIAEWDFFNFTWEILQTTDKFSLAL